MKNLLVSFENCYGIKKLNETFDFTETNTYAIYISYDTLKYI